MKKGNMLGLLFIVFTACNGQIKTGTESKPVLAFADVINSKSVTIPEWSCDYAATKFSELKEEHPYRGPGNFVKSVIQDSKGNIWFGSGEGIFKYDISRVNHPCTKKTCKHNLEKPDELAEHNVELNKAFNNITADKGMIDFHVNYIFEDSKGVMWFGTTYHGLCRYDGTTFTSFRKKDGLNDNFVNWIYEDHSGKLWIATEAGICTFNGKEFAKLNVNDGLIHNAVFTITEDKSGKLWFGTEGGISIYDEQKFNEFKNSAGKSFQTVRSIKFDNEGNLWIGSLNGVSKFNFQTAAGSNSAFTDFTVKNGLADNFVYSITQDKKGNFWFAVCDEYGSGKGVCFYDGKTFKTITKADGLIGDKIYSIIQDAEGKIWFASAAGVSLYDNGKFYNITERGQVEGC